MGVSTYYLGLPRTTLATFQREEGCFEVMQALWHAGAGAWTAADELDRNELLEIVGELPSERDAGAVLDRYTALVRAANEEYPQIAQQRAYLEKTHDYHEAMLASWMSRRSVPDASGLASVAVNGGEGGEPAGDLWCTAEPTVKLIGSALRDAGTRELLDGLPTLAEVLQDKLYWLEDAERREHLLELTTDEELEGELAELLSLYVSTGAMGHVVLIG